MKEKKEALEQKFEKERKESINCLKIIEAEKAEKKILEINYDISKTDHDEIICD